MSWLFLSTTGFVALLPHKILDISVFTYGELADVDNIGPLQNIENLAVIFDNMDKTGTYLQERFIAVDANLEDQFGAVGEG